MNPNQGISGKLDTFRNFKKLSSLTILAILLSGTPESKVFNNLQDLPAWLADLPPTSSLTDICISDRLYGSLQIDRMTQTARAVMLMMVENNLTNMKHNGRNYLIEERMSVNLNCKYTQMGEYSSEAPTPI